MPGTEATKTFTIKSDKVTNEDGVKYAISLIITENTFEKTDTDLVYSLKGTSNGQSGTVAPGGSNLTLNQYHPDSGSTTVSLGNGVLKGESPTHSYTFAIRFREMGSDQNSNQGKRFNAAIKVTTSDTGDVYYTSANPEGTSDMPGSDAGISSGEE